MPRYLVNKAFPQPSGAIARQGETVELTERQAKYLLLAGKISLAAPAGKKTSGTAKAANTTAQEN